MPLNVPFPLAVCYFQSLKQERTCGRLLATVRARSCAPQLLPTCATSVSQQGSWDTHGSLDLLAASLRTRPRDRLTQQIHTHTSHLQLVLSSTFNQLKSFSKPPEVILMDRCPNEPRHRLHLYVLSELSHPLVSERVNIPDWLRAATLLRNTVAEGDGD